VGGSRGKRERSLGKVRRIKRKKVRGRAKWEGISRKGQQKGGGDAFELLTPAGGKKNGRKKKRLA